MGASNSDSKKTKFFSLFGKSSAEDKPAFRLSEKVGGKWTTTATYDTLSGRLIYAGIQQKEWQGVKFNVFILKLEDNGELLQVEMKHTSATHSIINSLCSIQYDSLQDLYMRVYQTVKKDKYYAGAVVKFGSNDLKWKFQFSEVPQKVAVMLPSGEPFMQNGKQVYDDTLTKKFWEAKFEEFVVKQVGMSSSLREPSVHKSITPNQDFEMQNDAASIQLDDSDLPF